MIIKWDGIAGGKIDTGMHYSLDLLPTLSEMLNVEKSDFWDGVSFVDELNSGDKVTDNGRNALIISQNAHVCQEV